MSQQILKRWPVVLILALGLAIGSWLGNDFGVSWDEVRNANVGAAALRAYSGGDDYFDAPSIADHGPAYFMLFSAGSQAMAELLPSWTEADGRHLINFSTFLVAVLSFYFLSRRIVRPPYDWMATALFATQPLLFGYGFIGQKDVSFMAGFMATLALGLAALDRWGSLEARGDSPSTLPPRFAWDRLASAWKNLSRGFRGLLAVVAAAVVILFLDLFIFQRLRGLGRSVIEAAYRGSASAPVQAIFDRLATDAYKTTLDAYLVKYDDFYASLTTAILVGMCVALLAAFSLTLPAWRARSGHSLGLRGWAAWLVSGIVLGFTVSMRPVGAFAGLLVSLEAVRLSRAKAILPLAAYWLVASLATLGTWPYLWPSPISRMIESLKLAAEFSHHGTLFRGMRVSSGELPWDFFPTLTALQLTETAVLLIIVGLCVIFWRRIRRERQGALVGLLLLWVGIPLILLIGFKTSGYEFRHFLFMLPPLLLVAAIGLETIGEWVRRSWRRALLFVLVIAPGVLGIAQLHPYEYIYFNSFAGGVSGADGSYQLERECLSYREAVVFVNGIAEPGAVVIVPQQTNQVLPYAREDLVIRGIGDLADADFVLSCTWRDANDFSTEGFARVFRIQRGTAILTEVLQRAAGS
jgi:hypothetical protein